MPRPETLLSLMRAAGHEPLPVPVRRPQALVPYDGASTGRRTVGWTPTNENINSLLNGSSEILRNRSREAARKNPWVSNALDSLVGNIISTGIKPQSQHSDPAVKDAIQKAFLRWTDEADADGLTDFYGLQALAVRSLAEAGECFIRLRYRRAQDKMFVPLQLQVLESEMLPNFLNEQLPNGNVIRAGIEFDPIGKRVAYHFFKEHPGAGVTSLAGLTMQTVRVMATEILHLFRPIRAGQMRGQPWLAPVLVTLYELDQYDDAELVRKKIAAMFAAFITEANPAESILPTSLAAGGTSVAPEGIEFAGLEPGTTQKLLPGEDIKFATPSDVGGMYVEFMRVQLRKVAAGLGITYEQLTGDLTGVNYSSIRAGLLEFRRRAEQFQHSVVVFQFCRPVWTAWLDQAVVAAAFKAPGYARDPAPYQAVKWIAPGWPWVDPLKDITAARLNVRCGFDSRSSVVSEGGEDTEAIDREQAADNARADKLGLIYDSDGRQAVDGSGGNKKDGIQASVSDRKPTQDNEQPVKLDQLNSKLDDVLVQLHAVMEEIESEERAQAAPQEPPTVTVNTAPVNVNVTPAAATPSLGRKLRVIKRDRTGLLESVDTSDLTERTIFHRDAEGVLESIETVGPGISPMSAER